MSTIFISDLHLHPCRPEITESFLSFLAGTARDADALYILGDLFEAWIGDDAPDADQSRITDALRQFTGSGPPCYFAHGNRDFLIGQRFSQHSGVTLLAESTVIELYGDKILLLHGDTLCTDDHRYQRFRRFVRNPSVHKIYFALPVSVRRAIVGGIRKSSAQTKVLKPDDIMDVNQSTVESKMRASGVYRLIHGHTHRPAVHEFTLDDRPASRIVLGDWYAQGSFLEYGPGGYQLHSLPIDG